MGRFEGLPSKRQSIRGLDRDGEIVWLSHSISKSLYRCPGCRGEIAIGLEHVLVRFVPEQADAHHQHWHTHCARATLLRELTSVEIRPAQEGDAARSRQGKGARRAAALRRRTHRGR